MNFCEYAHRRFLEYLQEDVRLNEMPHRCRLFLPFKNPDNDEFYIDILADSDTEGTISDNCQCVQFLYLNGINVEGDNKHKKALIELIDDFGFNFNDGMITKRAVRDTIHYDLMDLIQLMNEAFGISSIEEGQDEEIDFISIVHNYLETQSIDYEKKIIIPGATINHEIDISFNQREEPVYVKSISTKMPGVALRNSELVSFTFLDLKNAKRLFCGIALLDDKYSVWGEEPINVLKAYSDKVIRWSDREELDLLAKGKKE